ncbi:hypothetical protein [Nocardia wallacei]|uniref:hypothetical protein n=1 Tax=Nocardia wallacei TaxID=480035 RepID=UPI002455F8E0|nr:hypothetical protein [Nocardia wallacei]
MAKGTFSYRDETGYPRQIVDPREYNDYNVTIAAGDISNATDVTATLFTGRNGSGRSDSIYPGGSRYGHEVYLSCRFSR